MKRSTTAIIATAAILSGMLGSADSSLAAPGARHFSNCTAMHKVYPHGVGRQGARDHVTSGSPVTNFKRNDALYNANTGSDRDHDHVACEAH